VKDLFLRVKDKKWRDECRTGSDLTREPPLLLFLLPGDSGSGIYRLVEEGARERDFFLYLRERRLPFFSASTLDG